MTLIGKRAKASEALELHDPDLFPAAHPSYADPPLIVERAKGHTVWDVEGKAYLDFDGGAPAVIVGHGNDHVSRRLSEQLGRAQRASTLPRHEALARLAEMIAAVTPGRLQECLFTPGGSEANEVAVTAARAATGNETVVTPGHASSRATVGGPGHSASRRRRNGVAVDADVVHLRSPYGSGAALGLDEERLVDQCVRELEATLGTAPEGRIAAFVAEPVLAGDDFATLPRTYLRRVEPLVREAGGLLVIDETGTGWGRSGGVMCAVEHWGVPPDIMTFANGMANGAPIGCAVTVPQVADAMSGVAFPTFDGDPGSVVAALATLEVIERDDLPDNAYRQGLRLRMRLDEAAAEHPFVGEVRGLGLMQALEIVAPAGGRAGAAAVPDPDRADALLAAARERGLLIGKGGSSGNILRITPHLDVDSVEIDEGSARLSHALSDVA